MFVLTRVPLKVLEKTFKSKPPNFSHKATMVLRSMQTFSKFALIYESMNQLVRYFMGSFVILFLFFFLVFCLLLVNICLSLSCLLSFFVCFAQIFPWISFCCVLLCTLREPPYALNFWSSFNLSKMILIPSFFLEWGGGWGGEEKGHGIHYFISSLLFYFRRSQH